MSINVNSDTWYQINKWAQASLNDLREQNDNEQLDEVDTAFIRGQIQNLKDLLQLPKEQQPPPVVESGSYT